MKKDYLSIIKSGQLYHFYNHAVGDELLFYEDNDYQHFIEKLNSIVLPFGKLMAYCLLPTHYHLIIEINPDLKDTAGALVSNAFRKLGSQYAYYLNRKIGRKGTLFMRPFKRYSIEKEYYLEYLIMYVHLNPLGHKISDPESVNSYQWSSYQEIISNSSSQIECQEVIGLFRDTSNLIETHQMMVNKNMYQLTDYLEFGIG